MRFAESPPDSAATAYCFWAGNILIIQDDRFDRDEKSRQSSMPCHIIEDR